MFMFERKLLSEGLSQICRLICYEVCLLTKFEFFFNCFHHKWHAKMIITFATHQLHDKTDRFRFAFKNKKNNCSMSWKRSDKYLFLQIGLFQIPNQRRTEPKEKARQKIMSSSRNKRDFLIGKRHFGIPLTQRVNSYKLYKHFWLNSAKNSSTTWIFTLNLKFILSSFALFIFRPAGNRPVAL